MIASVSGKLIFKGGKNVIIETDSLGWEVFVSSETLTRLPLEGENVKLWTVFYLRQEGTAELYGFLTREELEFFELLNSVAGIGPKSALGIMGIAPLDRIKAAIVSGDAGLLTKVSGVGKKSAARIILELRSKVSATDRSKKILSADVEAEEVLLSLGYQLREARAALEKIPEIVASTEDRVREALKILGRHA